MGVQSVIFEIIHESLMNKDTELSVSALCEIAGVSRSGYYRCPGTSYLLQLRSHGKWIIDILALQISPFS